MTRPIHSAVAVPISLMAFVPILVIVVDAQAVGLRTETFDVDPQWTSVGDGVNGNDFGFRTSDIAGGSPGEGGGRFARTDSTRFYADTDFPNTVRLDQPFQASGRLDLGAVDANPDFGNPLWLGHFNPDSIAKAGLFFNDGPPGPGLAWSMSIAFPGGIALSPTPQMNFQPGVDRTWSYAWDPIGGVGGVGRLTGTLSGPDGGSRIVDVDWSGVDPSNVTFTAFGFNAGVNPPASAERFADIFVDDLLYTVPEPSTFALAALGMLGMLACGWRQRRRV